MEGEKRDVELDAAAKAVSEDVSEESEDTQEPTTDKAGPMTPTAGSVQEANVDGVKPD
jgi:hypothetical protein